MLKPRVAGDVRGREGVLERVHEHVRPDDAPLGEARIAQDPVEDQADHPNAAEVSGRRQPARHAETRVDRGEAVGGICHEVLALPALAELAIEHEIGGCPNGAAANTAAAGRGARWLRSRRPAGGDRSKGARPGPRWR